MAKTAAWQRKEYKGATHKMNGQVHTGAKHSPSSKVLKHTKPRKK